MQLMPETAADMNVNDVYNPEDNIRGGVRLLGLLDEFFAKRGVAEDERLYFILAGYNAGHGRIEKCMEAAEAMDLDKYKWASIYSVINMSIEGKRSKVALPKFHTRETLDFVDTIIKIYEHYRCFVS
jgi:membrane-bound lytic murein transglycosylase MltF